MAAADTAGGTFAITAAGNAAAITAVPGNAKGKTAATTPAASNAVSGKTAVDRAAVGKRAEDAVSAITAAYAKKTSLSDWEAYGLLLNGGSPPKSYFTALDKKVKNAKGVFRKVTDYARLALVYRAAGKNPARAAGYDLIGKICSFGDIGKQGANGPIWALLALNGRTLPKNAKWNVGLLADEILKYQLPGGGFALSASKNASADADITCMAVVALSAAKEAQKDGDRLRKAMDSALGYLADNADTVKKTSEAVSQYVIALCAAGADASAWVDVLLGWRLGDGTFAHEKDGKSDAIATEQALLALTAYARGGSVY